MTKCLEEILRLDKIGRKTSEIFLEPFVNLLDKKGDSSAKHINDNSTVREGS